jgi:hypothetical protein
LRSADIAHDGDVTMPRFTGTPVRGTDPS